VRNAVVQQPNMFTGGVDAYSTTQVYYASVTRFPPDRQAEAARVRDLCISSHHTNPVWLEAQRDFFTRLSRIEHRGNMERIRLAGEQSRAYADEQARSSDQRMRTWEQRQASGDRLHAEEVRAIHGVEQWSDASGTVELNEGYKEAWSRPDGTYLLSNDPLFDPNVAFKENWSRMERPE